MACVPTEDGPTEKDLVGLDRQIRGMYRFTQGVTVERHDEVPAVQVRIPTAEQKRLAALADLHEKLFYQVDSTNYGPVDVQIPSLFRMPNGDHLSNRHLASLVKTYRTSGYTVEVLTSWVDPYTHETSTEPRLSVSWKE